MNKSKCSLVSVAVFVACSTLTTVLILSIKLTGLNDTRVQKTTYHFRSESLRNLSESELQEHIDSLEGEEQSDGIHEYSKYGYSLGARTFSSGEFSYSSAYDSCLPNDTACQSNYTFKCAMWAWIIIVTFCVSMITGGVYIVRQESHNTTFQQKSVKSQNTENIEPDIE